MLFSQLKVLHSHGVQYIKELDRVTLPERFRGRPTLAAGAEPETVRQLAALCPTGAISAEPFALDLGRCIFCNECSRYAPGTIVFGNDYRLGTTDRRALVIESGNDSPVPFHAQHVRAEIVRCFGHALRLREVCAGGDGSTEMELNATMNVNFDFGRYGIEFVASPRHADGVVVSGPITRNMARALETCWEAVPEPKVLVLAGSDAISGGLFAEGGDLDRSLLEKLQPDLYLPGNPVHPMTFIDGILNLTGRKKRAL